MTVIVNYLPVGSLLRFTRALLRAAVVLAVCCANFALAQDEEDEPKLPDPEDITLESRDNVVLKATYWEPLEPDKETVPVILLHGWEGRRQEYDALGRILQQQYNHAVISVDLRGHGGSTVVRRPNANEDLEIDPERMSRDDFLAMVYDVQAAKNHLVKKHKEGKLNIELLTVVGADMGATVALNFAVYDWNKRRVAARIFKTGQDVRGLVLLSPPRSFKGLTSELALKQPVVRSAVSTMIIVGANDDRAYRDAKNLHKSLERFHVKVDRDATAAEKEEKMDLFLMEPKTTLQGTKLLADALKTDQMIAKFIDLRLVKKSDEVPWMERE